MSRFWFLRKDEFFWKVFIISFHSTETIHACGTQLLSQNGACVENCQLPYYNFCLGILLLGQQQPLCPTQCLVSLTQHLILLLENEAIFSISHCPDFDSKAGRFVCNKVLKANPPPERYHLFIDGWPLVPYPLWVILWYKFAQEPSHFVKFLRWRLVLAISWLSFVYFLVTKLQVPHDTFVSLSAHMLIPLTNFMQSVRFLPLILKIWEF